MWGLAGSFRIGNRWTIRTRLDNLTDRVYETYIGFPGPRRGCSVWRGSARDLIRPDRTALSPQALDWPAGRSAAYFFLTFRNEDEHYPCAEASRVCARAAALQPTAFQVPSARPGQRCPPWPGLVRYANASGSSLPGLPVLGRASRFPAALSPPVSSRWTSAARGRNRSLFTSAPATACTWWSAGAGCGSSRTGCGSPSPSSKSAARSGAGATTACWASPCTRTSWPTATSTCSTSSTPTTCSQAATPRTATTPSGTSISTPRSAGSPAIPPTLRTTGRRSSRRAVSCSWARRRAPASPSCTSRTAWARSSSAWTAP